MKFRKIVALFCIASQPLMLSGCDTFADFVKNISDTTVTEKSGSCHRELWKDALVGHA